MEKEIYIAEAIFRDENNFSRKYEIGEDVSHLSDQTLDRLQKLGVVKKAEEPKGKKGK